MELLTYIDRNVQIVLYKGFTYIGKVTGADSNSITIIDKTGAEVCLKEDSIEFIKVMSQ